MYLQDVPEYNGLPGNLHVRAYAFTLTFTFRKLLTAQLPTGGFEIIESEALGELLKKNQVLAAFISMDWVNKAPHHMEHGLQRT